MATLKKARKYNRTALAQLLQEVAVAANEALTIDEAMQFAVDRVCACTGWPVGHAYRRNDNSLSNRLIPADIWHLEQPEKFAAFRQATRQTCFDWGEGLPGRVLATGEPAWIFDVTRDTGFARAAQARDVGLKAGFAFPVLVGKEVMAVLEFFSGRPVMPDAALLDVMAHIGAQLGRVVERKLAEDALRESEEKFRALTQTTPEAVVIADGEGYIVFWNQSAQAIFGYSQEEVINRPLTLLMPARYRNQHQQGLEKFRAGGQSTLIGRTTELAGLRKDGREFPLELSLATWTAGEKIFFGGIIRDITRRKEAEELIKERERQLAEAQQIAQVGSWSWDIASNRLIWSDELYRIYGLDPQQFEASYESFLLRVHDSDRNLVRAIVEQAYDNHQPFGFEHRIVRPDGSVRLLQARGRVAVDEKGQPIKMFGTGQDITERRQAEDALRESEARFRAIFEGAAIGISLTDLDKRIVESNPALQKMLGYSRNELRQILFTQFTHPDDVEINLALYRELVAGKRDRFQLEKRYLRKDGSQFWGRLSVSLVRGADGTPQFAIGMVEDITERKQIEAELAEVQQRLMENREAERLHLAQELHDGPLQDLHAIAMGLAQLEPELQSEAGISRLAGTQATIQHVIKTLRAICGELRPPALAPFGLEKAIRSHVEAFQKNHPALEIGLNLMPDGQTLPEQTRLALFRIYQQALDNITQHAAARQVDVRFQIEPDQIVLEVQDDGCGFKVPRRRVELARQGHLGLVGAAERAEALGGWLNINSSPGQGTLIQAVVPLVKDVTTQQ